MSATESQAAASQARTFQVRGQLVDIRERRTYAAKVSIVDGKITAITPTELSGGEAQGYLLPGFIDAHIHVESSMLVPTEFARAAVVHGTVATVSDPHEIGNVLGVEGVQYMLADAEKTPLKICFGAPSCVPATTFETAGAAISVAEVEALLDDPRIGYLSEMMNFPGVLGGDPECLAKIAAAKQRNKPVDGHAPGLCGEDARAYVEAGMTTDHECFTKEEALDKVAAGCKIAIREGSAARNFDALYKLLGEFPDQTMLCSDDKHPDELLLGHINLLVRRAVERGIDVYDALQAACLNPIEHYSLHVGQLRVGDPADFIEVDSLEDFNVRRTWIDGQLVAQDGKTTLPYVEPTLANRFVVQHVAPEDLLIPENTGSELRAAELRVIEALDGQLITNSIAAEPLIVEGSVQSDSTSDILKMVVVNRYQEAPPVIAFVKNFGLKRGAMASSVAHDCHNVIAVGVSDDDLSAAINAVMDAQGGLSAVCHEDGIRHVLPLPVAGLMGTGTAEEIAHAYEQLDQAVKSWGSPLRAPYMTLSFMALLVIPELKLSDRGLFDGGKFEFCSIWQGL
ncbi:adenine deaminase [Adhaeretor mobilis]|uniref:Adenine deaminase n=1 Tax=Adhaeretor mobilis TaxID=1930276 RepID=A0A517MUS2_9BACT|nr:adenine deaminase [Adhaeretor mobilis]QDS98632.1 Adenine deaminase [Adhaeretor mobilis]